MDLRPSPPEDAWLALGRAVLQSQPFSVWLGAELTQLGTGRAELQLALQPQHRQQSGFAHGAVVAYLVDNAMSFAGGSMLGADVLSGEYKLSIVRPASGQRLLARATVLHAGRLQAVCRCDVSMVDEQGALTLCATALGTIVRTGAR